MKCYTMGTVNITNFLFQTIYSYLRIISFIAYHIFFSECEYSLYWSPIHFILQSINFYLLHTHIQIITSSVSYDCNPVQYLQLATLNRIIRTDIPKPNYEPVSFFHTCLLSFSISSTSFSCVTFMTFIFIQTLWYMY